MFLLTFRIVRQLSSRLEHQTRGQSPHGVDVHAGLVGILRLVQHNDEFQSKEASPYLVSHGNLELLDVLPGESLNLVLQNAFCHPADFFLLLEPIVRSGLI